MQAVMGWICMGIWTIIRTQIQVRVRSQNSWALLEIEATAGKGLGEHNQGPEPPDPSWGALMIRATALQGSQ